MDKVKCIPIYIILELVVGFLLVTPELKAMQAAPAEIQVSKGSIAFGIIVVGGTSDEQTFTIENTGDETLNVTVSITGVDPTDFFITGGGGSYSIPGGTTSDVSVVFSPTSRGSKNADVRIDHDATNVSSPQTVDLSGTGAPAVLYVDQSATGTESGLNWTDAYTDLQDALCCAAEGASIWVAAGTYKPTSGTDSTISFTIDRDIELYGGFSGSETLLNERDWKTNPTTLSGDIGIQGTPDDNSVHVVWIQNVTSSARIDGFTISDGYAGDGNTDDTSNIFDIGGGILCEGSLGKTCNPVLANLIISDNHAERGGADCLTMGCRVPAIRR